jgi:hypothetical protein
MTTDQDQSPASSTETPASPTSAADPIALDREQMADLATAVGELSQAMGSPCVFGKYPATLLSATVRQAAFRLRSSAAAAVPPSHIKQPYTVAEIRERIASGDYSAELMLQHAMLHLSAAAVPDEREAALDRVVQAGEALVSHAKGLAWVRAKGHETDSAERCHEEAHAEWTEAVAAARASLSTPAAPVVPEPLTDELLAAGTALSNVAFNWAQQDRFTEAERAMLKAAQKRWDAARAALAATTAPTSEVP